MSRSLPDQQVAALPYRQTREGLDILLITTRETRRWVIPKGWPMKGLKNFDAAHREAVEEAGVVGRISKTKVGQFEYHKRASDQTVTPCIVDVYPLEVQSLLASWPEQNQRVRQWFKLQEAAALLQEQSLRKLVLAFEESLIDS